MTSDADGDLWSRWLLERRYRGDTVRRLTLRSYLRPLRDRVLDNAGVALGGVLLDVGCGDGLIGFGALPRVGESGRVIFSDVSLRMLEHCRSLARERGVLDRSRFVHAPADDLSAIPDASVDVVTTRSVLIYVEDKRRAFEEFGRVLKPGGRLSIFEPIGSFFGYPPPTHLFGWQTLYDVTPVADLAGRVRAVWERVRSPESPLMDFTERDLVRFAEDAGFAEVALTMEVEVAPAQPARSWEARWNAAPNPLAPTLAEAVAEALTDDEAARFVAHLRPLVLNGQGQRRSAAAYLRAVKGNG